MPAGKTHDKITWWCVPFVLGLTWISTQQLGLAFLTTAAFIFAGLMFSGDLDVKSVQYKRWGPLRWIWIPYQKMVPHRSAFSHGPVLGVLARLCYFTIIASLIFFSFTRLALLLKQEMLAQQAFEMIHHFASYMVNHPLHFWVIILGLWLGGLSHTLADEIGSAWKKRKRKQNRQKKKRQGYQKS